MIDHELDIKVNQKRSNEIIDGLTKYKNIRKREIKRDRDTPIMFNKSM